jgi:CBS domain-containing protein
MLIEDLLTEKSRYLFTIELNNTVEHAIAILAENDIGALPVCDATGRMVGIMSERDIVRSFNKTEDTWRQLKVSNIMKKKVISAAPGDNVRDVIAVMNEKRIRHVPVLEDSELVAMFSVRDLFSYLLKATQAQRDTMTMAYEMLR